MPRNPELTYRVCAACRIPHVENCRTCAGFGMTEDGGMFITAGEAHDGPLPPWKECPECGGTPEGHKTLN